MANRRMFALTIVDSDAFLDMPPSTQNLYFHLGMRADDDGFVNNPKTITRYIGSKDDDLKLLEAKKFIISFPSGVIVLKHWRINNYLQSDRITPTKYQKEKCSLDLHKNGAYSLVKEHEINKNTECIQNVYNVYTQESVVKSSLDKNSIGEERVNTSIPTPTQVNCEKRAYGQFKNVRLTDDQYDELQKNYPSLYQEYIDRLDRYIGKSGRKFNDHYITIDSWIIEDNKKNKSNITTQNDDSDLSGVISEMEKQSKAKEITDEEYAKLLSDLKRVSGEEVNTYDNRAS